MRLSSGAFAEDCSIGVRIGRQDSINVVGLFECAWLASGSEFGAFRGFGELLS